MWLRDDKGIVLKGHVENFGSKFISKGKGKEKKLDDLADCLLQAMACLKWEQNRKLICENGEAALEELEGMK